jgi:hypothetical protein
MKKLKIGLWMSVASLVLLGTIVPTAFAGVRAVPEVDLGIAGSAAALLVGGYLVLVAKIRRR